MEIGILFYGILLILLSITALVELIILVVGLCLKKKENVLTISGAVIFIVFALSYLALEPTQSSEITPEIEGTYKFKYPTGQVEVIHIKRDYTFNQAIYANDSVYSNNGNVLLKNAGSWNASGDNLEFYNWLFYCEFCNPNQIVTIPYLSTMSNVSWYSATSDHNELITPFLENNYVFEKVER